MVTFKKSSLGPVKSFDMALRGRTKAALKNFFRFSINVFFLGMMKSGSHDVMQVLHFLARGSFTARSRYKIARAEVPRENP